MQEEKEQIEKREGEATHGVVEEKEEKSEKKIKKIEKSVDKGEVVWYNSKAHLRNGSLETAHEWVMHLEN